MTDEERAIWQAAYAAAFVTHFDAMHVECQRDRSSTSTTAPFDRAMQVVTAERAITLADAAVRRLQQWRATERRDDGVTLGCWPKLWDDD